MSTENWKPEDDYPILGLSTNSARWSEAMKDRYESHNGFVQVPEAELEAWFANCIETSKRAAVANLPLPPMPSSFRSGRPTF